MKKLYLLFLTTLLCFTALAETTIPNNTIYYTTSDGMVCTLINWDASIFGANIISNTYENGQGIMTFNKEVTSIGDYAFYGCNSLISIEIPNSVTSIGYEAFDGCHGVTNIVIPKSVTSIGNSAFFGCSGLTNIKVDNGNKKYDSRENCNAIIETSTNTLIAGCQNTTIPNSVTSIENNAFSGCSGLTCLEIPNSVTSIGSFAFSGCSGLTSIVIPYNVTSIEYGVFSYCSGLTNIVIPNSVTSIGNSAFLGCSGLTNIEIPNSVTSIRENAFTDCRGLTSIDIPNSVTSIGNNAFQDCSSLTRIKMPDFMTSIKDGTFYGCSSLTYIELPYYVTYIGDYAFRDCSSLASVKIPNFVTSIGKYAFNGCSKLATITCIAQTPPVCGSNGFYNVPSTAKLYVPQGTTDAYKNAYGWNLFSNIIEIAPEVVCTSISLDNATDTLNVGKTLTLTATILPDNATNKKIEWKSSNTAVATVADGIVTAVGLGTATIIATTTDGSNLSVTCSVTVAPESTPLDITDGTSEAFEITQEKQYETVNYTRNFSDNNWQPLYIPFEMTYDEWTTEGLEVARLNGFYQYDDDEDGKIDRSVLEVIKIKEGKLMPNYPYLVKSNTVGEKKITLKNKTVYCTESNSVDCSTVATTYTFTGTYATKRDLASDGCYYMKDGDIVLAENAEESVPAFSWYLTAENRKYYGNTPKFKRIKLRVTGEDYKLGDPNNDRYIDIGDYTTIANYILGTISDTFVEKAADVNCDGEINVGDLTAEANLILYGDNTAQAKPRYAADGEATIYAGDVTITAGESVDLSVKMKNDVPMTGFQFDVVMPEGLSIAMDEDGYYCIDLSTERTTTRNTNTFDSALQADGSVRVLAGSTKSKTFEGTDGEVCIITVKAAEGIADGTYTVVLKNIIMSDATGKTYKVDRSEATVTIDSATGITAIGTKALNGKYMKDGKLTIVRNGKKYTAVGMEE